MSTDWDFYCRDCDEEMGLHDCNHCDDELAEVLPHLGFLRALYQSVRDVPVTVRVETGDRMRELNPAWIMEHGHHNVAVRSEYGDLIGTCSQRIKCPECGSNHRRCNLEPGHEGPCAEKG